MALIAGLSSGYPGYDCTKENRLVELGFFSCMLQGKIHSVHVPLILPDEKAEKDGIWLIPATHQRDIQW